MICRAFYERDGRQRSVTFGGDIADLADFIILWEQIAGVQISRVDTMIHHPLLADRHPPHYTRIRNSKRGSA